MPESGKEELTAPATVFTRKGGQADLIGFGEHEPESVLKSIARIS